MHFVQSQTEYCKGKQFFLKEMIVWTEDVDVIAGKQDLGINRSFLTIIILRISTAAVETTTIIPVYNTEQY